MHVYIYIYLYIYTLKRACILCTVSFDMCIQTKHLFVLNQKYRSIRSK